MGVSSTYWRGLLLADLRPYPPSASTEATLNGGLVVAPTRRCRKRRIASHSSLGTYHSQLPMLVIVRVGWCTNWCSGCQARSLALIARAPHSLSIARLPGRRLHLRRVVIGCRRRGRCPTGCLSPGGSGLVCLPGGWYASA